MAITVALTIAAIATGGVAAPAAGVAALMATPVVVSILGAPAAVTAVAIAVAGGGVGVLNKLRKYKLRKETKPF